MISTLIGRGDGKICCPPPHTPPHDQRNGRATIIGIFLPIVESSPILQSWFLRFTLHIHDRSTSTRPCIALSRSLLIFFPPFVISNPKAKAWFVSLHSKLTSLNHLFTSIPIDPVGYPISDMLIFPEEWIVEPST